MVSCSLNSDKFLVAMLQLRNTPYRDCQKSLAEIIYEHQLQDNVAFLNNLDKFSNTAVCGEKHWNLKKRHFVQGLLKIQKPSTITQRSCNLCMLAVDFFRTNPISINGTEWSSDESDQLIHMIYL